MNLQLVIRIVSALVAFTGAVAGPLAGLDPQLSFFLTIFGLVGAAALPGLKMFNGNHLFTSLAVVVAITAAVAGPISEMYPELGKWLGLASVGLMALGKDLWADFGVGADDDDDLPPGRFTGLLLCLALTCGGQIGCFKQKNSSDATKNFAVAVFTVDAASVKGSELMRDFAQSGNISRESAVRAIQVFQRVHAANGKVISFAQKYTTTDEAGQRVLRFDQAGKLELLRLSQDLADTLRDALAFDLLFPGLAPEKRAELQLLVLALTTTGQTIVNTIRLLKPVNLKTGQLTLLLPKEVIL